MAPRKKNPIDDIGSTVGGWLGGAAKSLNVFLTGDQNPTMNPQTRAGIRALQEIGEQTTGGAVSAMQQGPEAVQRYVMTQAAIAAAAGGVGAVAPKVVSKAAQTKAGQAVARKAGEVAFEARMLTPMTRRQAINTYRRPVMDKFLETRRQAMNLQDELDFIRGKSTLPDYDYLDLYEAYNPVARETQETIRMIEETGRRSVSPGRQNRMLMEGAKTAYAGIEEFAEDELRFAKRAMRERGKSVRRMLEVRRARLNAMPPAERAIYIEREAAQRAAKLRRQLDLSNARRNMPENYIDPEDFFK